MRQLKKLSVKLVFVRKWIRFLQKKFFDILYEPYTAFFLSTQFFLPASSHGFIYPQSSVLQAITSSSSVFFPFLFHRTRHGGVGQRSGSRLETKNKRNWALPRAFLNHMSLGVDVPFFLHPVKNSSKLCNNSSFGVAHSLKVRLCGDVSAPALCQNRVAVGLSF